MAFLSCDKDDRDSNLLATKRFIGTARTDISCLEFIKPREIDHPHVEHLVSVFQKTRCRRYDPENFIPVLITQAKLKRALRVSDLTQTSLRNAAPDGSLCFLKTAKNQKLSCVRGQHRIKAAENFLHKSDHWWTIKIFLVESEGIEANNST